MPATSLSPLTPRAANSAPTRKAARGAALEIETKCVLSISPSAEDHEMLREILAELSWEFRTAANCVQAREQLRRQRVTVVFCESKLGDGTWKDILAHIRDEGQPPLLIVTSRVADEYLWAEVLNLGGYDVLAKPFSQTEIRHALTTVSLWPAQSAPRVQTAGVI